MPTSTTTRSPRPSVSRSSVRPTQARDLAAPSSPDADSETFATLRDMAHGKTLRIPPELLAEHVLAVTHDADWPVRRAAMEAVIRRCGFARQDGLRVASRPPGGDPLGVYSTRRPRSVVRPYRTVLGGVRPIRGSCDCPDFLRGSLGLCKHLLTVIDSLGSSPRRLARALAADETGGARPARVDGPAVVWDPVRPLTGRGDWLERVRLVGVDGRRTNDTARLPAAMEPARRWFRRDGAADSGLVLRDAFPDRPGRRAELIDDLARVTGRDRRRGRRRGPVDPALHALIAAERRRLDRVLADQRNAGVLKRTQRSLRRKLYPYQKEGVERLFRTGRLLLADDMGLGKTVQAIAACHGLWRTGRVKRGLLIVPASLKAQWLREWRLFTDAPAAVVDGNPEQRRETFERCRKGFLIVNYEQVLRDLDVMRTWSPGIVVLDEAQRIKNWATKTAASVKQLRPPYRLVLTGTPMENRLDELASIMDWVDDLALEPKWRLVPLHAVHVDGAKEIGGARHLDTLRARLAPCMLRRTRQEILRQLPPRTDSVIPVELTDEQREEHDALSAPIARLASIAQRRPLTQAEFLRLMMLLTTQRMIANGLAQVEFEQTWPRLAGERTGGRRRRPDAALLRSLNSPKLVELREIIAQIALQQQRKVVVFSQWRRMLALAHWVVEDLLGEHGVRAAFFTGKERQKRREQNIVEFHDDPETRVLFATDAGGVGLNLQRAATCCINIELPWNPAVLEQRIGRIYRLGQKDPVDTYNLVAQDCIESRIASLVADKRALFTGLFDGTSDQVRFERSGSFISNIGRIAGSAAAVDEADMEAGAAESDAAVEAEIEEMLAAADESQDAGEVAGAAEARAAVAKEVAATLPAAATEGPALPLVPAVSATPAATPPAPPTLPTAAEVKDLFAQLEIEPTADGGVRINAPPEAAASLASVFEGMAALLRGAGPRSDGG